eukprot:1149881-Pelagomonas_calceolata.AAC.4
MAMDMSVEGRWEETFTQYPGCAAIEAVHSKQASHDAYLLSLSLEWGAHYEPCPEGMARYTIKSCTPAKQLF